MTCFTTCDSPTQSVFPGVQSVRLSPRTGQTPSLRPLDGTDAQLQFALTYARDGRPGPIGVLVYVSYSNFMSIMSVLLRSETCLFSNASQSDPHGNYLTTRFMTWPKHPIRDVSGCEECDSASDIILEGKVEGLESTRCEWMRPKQADSALLLRLLKMVNARISALYLCIFHSLWLRCGVITEPIGDGLGLQVTPVLTQDGGYLQVTPLFTQDARPLPEVPISKKKTAGPPVNLQDGRPYPPGQDGRDYRTPGPWRPDGTVGNTTHSFEFAWQL